MAGIGDADATPVGVLPRYRCMWFAFLSGRVARATSWRLDSSGSCARLMRARPTW